MRRFVFLKSLRPEKPNLTFTANQTAMLHQYPETGMEINLADEQFSRHLIISAHDSTSAFFSQPCVAAKDVPDYMRYLARPASFKEDLLQIESESDMPEIAPHNTVRLTGTEVKPIRKVVISLFSHNIEYATPYRIKAPTGPKKVNHARIARVPIEEASLVTGVSPLMSAISFRTN